jgi:integral membrane protein (TIGR00529 family)
MEATIKIGLLFVLLIIFIRRNIAVEWALLAGSVLLGILFLIPPKDFLRESFYGATATESLLLVGVVYFITVLGTFMDNTGHLNRLMDSLTELIGDSRYVAAAAPAIIGLMPMPGGAMFSAPMVESVSKPMGLSAERMTAINYWFRHVWEYIWPLYAGVLLTSSILNVNIPIVSLAQSPLSIACILAGLIFLIWDIPKPPKNIIYHTLKQNFGIIWHAMWPIAVVIVITMMPFPKAESVNLDAKILTTAKLFLSLVCTTFIFGYINGIKRKETWDVIVACLKKHTIMIIIAISIFSHLIEYSNAAIEMVPFFKEIGLPPIALIFLINFIVGMLTGITLAYVGICFPIIAPLMTAGGHVDLGLMQFAYASGYAGVMLTPIHLCFALTKEYYKCDWFKAYKLLIWPSLMLLLISLAIALIGLPQWD